MNDGSAARGNGVSPWEALLALFSFAFYRVARFGIRLLVRLHFRLRPGAGSRWSICSPEMLRQPGVLPAAMTLGPRWNTHAFIATAGPLPVHHSLELDHAAADRSAGVWTAVVSSFPSYRTVGVFSSGSGPSTPAYERLALKPGRYWLSIRYYRWREPMELPALRIDDRDAVPAAAVPRDPNRFFEEIRGRRGRFYLWLHYYVYVLLRLRDSLPASFVEREYLPFSNPETQFQYGALRAGETLLVERVGAGGETCSIFVTLYNRCSFPVEWSEVVGSSGQVRAEVDGFYLVRVLKNEASEEAIRVSVLASS